MTERKYDLADTNWTKDIFVVCTHILHLPAFLLKWPHYFCGHALPMSSRSVLALSASQEGKKVITAMKDNFAAVRAGLPPQLLLLLLLVCESGVTKSNGYASALWPLVLQWIMDVHSLQSDTTHHSLLCTTPSVLECFYSYLCFVGFNEDTTGYRGPTSTGLSIEPDKPASMTS